MRHLTPLNPICPAEPLSWYNGTTRVLAANLWQRRCPFGREKTPDYTAFLGVLSRY